MPLTLENKVYIGNPIFLEFVSSDDTELSEEEERAEKDRLIMEDCAWDDYRDRVDEARDRD